MAVAHGLRSRALEDRSSVLKGLGQIKGGYVGSAMLKEDAEGAGTRTYVQNPQPLQ
jgi:hypothetical protein